jgi:hypothetical protein
MAASFIPGNGPKQTITGSRKRFNAVVRTENLDPNVVVMKSAKQRV